MGTIENARSRVDEQLAERYRCVADALLLRNGRLQSDGDIRHSCLFHDDPGPSALYTSTTGFYRCFGSCREDDKPRAYDLDQVEQELERARPVPPNRDGRKPRRQKSRQPARTIDYKIRNWAGELVAIHERVEYSDGSKEMRWRHPDGRYSKEGEIDPAQLPLYGSEDMTSWDRNKPVTIHEGEKARDAAKRMGIQALGTVTGAGGTPCDESLAVLEGWHVGLWADNDKDGCKHMQQIGDRLVGKAAAVFRIVWPKAPPKGDAFDLTEQVGYDIDRFSAEVVEERFEATPKDVPAPAKLVDDFNLISVDELLAEPDDEAEWVIRDWFAVGGIGGVFAKPYGGKSTLVRQALYCVAAGEEFLGCEVRQGPAIYVGIEEHKRQAKAHIRQLVGSTRGLPLHLHFGRTPADALRKLGKHMQKIQPLMVGIDPLFKMVRVQNENAYAEVMTALEPIIALARETGCHLAFTHHSGKIVREGGDDILGSTAIFAALDTAIIERLKQGGVRTVEVIQKREGRSLPATIIAKDETGNLYLAGDAHAYEKEKVRRTVHDVVRTTAGSLTIDEIVEKVSLRDVAVKKALSDLCDAGTIFRTGEGKKGDPYRYWSGGPVSDSAPAAPVRTETKNSRRQGAAFQVQNLAPTTMRLPSPRIESETGIGSRRRRSSEGQHDITGYDAAQQTEAGDLAYSVAGKREHEAAVHDGERQKWTPVSKRVADGWRCRTCTEEITQQLAREDQP